ncbi:MAG: acylneuraminate cytidylyltransferase [Rhodobacteraceae bacterium]|nr:acylneuraminate cytidylyltransferase [Paracoccaceae bacterium]
MGPQVACIILARGGSKGIPRKNLRPIGGVSLIGRAVRAGRTAARVNAVYVSTDDAEIATESAYHGARIIDRPAALSGDTATSESGWLHALKTVRADLPRVERLVFLQCTSPFITGADIDGCLAAMAVQGADCALSVVEDHSFMWAYDTEGFGAGVNHDHTKQRQRRQDLPPGFKENGAIYCVEVAAFERTGQRFCGTVALFPVEHPLVEIDTEWDFQLCSMIALSIGRTEVAPNRLAVLRAVVMDFDGVHTDNLVTTDQDGRESVTTSRGDGMGLSLLRQSGRYRLMILSKERNQVVLRRAEKLGIEVYNEVDDKVAVLESWLAEAGLSWEQMVGNDLNDLSAMRHAGVAACPSDSHPSVLGVADWILPHPGGKGALRVLADTLLALPADE